MFLCATLLCALAQTTPCQQAAGADPPPASQAAPPDPGAAAPVSPATPEKNAAGDQNAAEDHRIFGLVPNYKAVNDPDQPFSPIGARAKFALVKHYFDPFTFVFTGITAGLEQATSEKESYGQGMQGYGKRYGADFADGFTNELFVVGVFPSILHEDPRYYRLGRGSAWKRTAYALSRILITKTDSGRSRFNTSEFLGNITSGAISMTYYPSNERSVSGVFTRMSVEIGYDSLFNLLKEFYPDLKRKFRKH